MSLRAELLLLSLRTVKIVKGAGKRRDFSIPTLRRRLALIEAIVPRPPSGTKTTSFDIDGINAVETLVRQARTDRCVLYFHGGGYAFGSQPLVRDFTWRLGAATAASVLYFDYRLAPELPFPAAVEDASKVYRWLVGHVSPTSIVFVGDSAGGGLLLATLQKMRDEGFVLPRAAVAISPWTDLALTGPSLHSNAKADPMMDVKRLPALARHYLGEADGIRTPHHFTATRGGCRRFSSRSAKTKFCATTPSVWRQSCNRPAAKWNSKNGRACRTPGITMRGLFLRAAARSSGLALLCRADSCDRDRSNRRLLPVW